MNGVQGFIHDQLGDGIPQARTDEIMGESKLCYSRSLLQC